MVANTQQRSSYYGWYMMPALILSVSIGYAFFTSALGPVTTDIQKEFGWSRAEIAAPFSLGSGAIAFAMPFFGWIIDKFGGRIVMILGSVGLAASVMFTSFTSSMWMWYAGWIGICIFQVFLTLIPVNKILTSWFQKRRGFAMGFLASGMAVAGVASAVWNFLIVGYGWHQAWFIMSFSPIIVLVLGLVLVRDRPADKGLKMDGIRMTDEERAQLRESRAPQAAQTAVKAAPPKPAEGEADFTTLDAMKTPTLWIFVFGSCMVAAAAYIRSTQQQPFLEGLGIDKITIGVMVSTVSLLGIPFGFLTGWVCDLLGKKRTSKMYGATCIVLGISIIILAFAVDTTLAWVSLTINSVGGRMSGTMPGLFIGQYFGPGAFAKIFAVRNFFLRFATMSSPLIAAWMWDTTGSYFSTFLMQGALLGVGAVLLIIAPMPKKGAPKQPVAVSA